MEGQVFCLLTKKLKKRDGRSLEVFCFRKGFNSFIDAPPLASVFVHLYIHAPCDCSSLRLYHPPAVFLDSWLMITFFFWQFFFQPFFQIFFFWIFFFLSSEDGSSWFVGVNP